MANRYKTVRGEAEGQLVIEKSKFIAAIRPVENQEEAEAFLSEVRSGSERISSFTSSSKIV